MFSFVFNDIDFAHKIDQPSNPTEDYYKHMHSFVELLYFMRGDVHYTVESGTRELKPGDIVLIAAGKYHFATVNLDNTHYERYVLKFPEHIVPDYLKKKLLAQNITFFTNTAKYAQLFTNFDYYYEDFTAEETYILFLSLLNKLLVMMNKSVNPGQQDINPFIEKVIAYINANLSQNITLKKLSRDLNYSESHISNEFNKYMHVPVMKYIRAKKIMLAADMISSGMKKCDVAEALGFSNYSTFFRAYRKIFDIQNKPKI